MLRARLVVIAAALVSLAACSSGDGGASGDCGPIRREALATDYLVHVLGTDTNVEYGSDPPTSGPHQPSPPVDGVVDEPITRPIQVGILERGDILVQHSPELADELASLAQERVVIAPNPDLPDPIVVTAWTYKRTCEAVDLDAIQQFIDERVGKGPEG